MVHVLLRAASLYFVVMFFIMVPAAAWNTPGADYSRSDCCFSSDCWDGKPGSNCIFSAKVDTSWDWQLKEWRGYNNPDAHIYLLQNGIRILQEKGYDNWAAYLADENNFQALADGATWADHYKGRWWVHVYATALLGVIEIPVYEFDPTCAAGWDHYYNSYQANSGGKGLESLDASVITQYFLDAFGPIISSGVITGALAGLQFLPVVGFVFQGLLALQTIGMVGIKIEISPAIRESYPSAGLLAEEHLDSAVDAYTATHDMTPRYWEHRSAQYDSLFQMGWATHFAQDVCVIYHEGDVWDTFEYYHAEFEDQATGLGDPAANSAYHVHEKDWKVAANYDALTVPEICREGAKAVDTPFYWEKAKSEEPGVRDVALQQGLKVADQVTAAMLAKYLTYLGIPKTVPPFNGTVRDWTTGKPVEGAYVFYREKLAFSGDPDAPGGVKGFIDQQRPWDYTITNLNGDFSLNLQQGRTYLVRAELPGYRYDGYIDVSTQEPITQKVATKTVEFTQGYAGEVTSGIHYWLYLSPTGTGALQMVSLVPAPVYYSYAGPDPSLPLAATVSPALRRDLADAVMTVRTDTTILSAQAPGASYPLQVPGETYLEVEVANLLNVGTATTLQSPKEIETTLVSAKTSWAPYHAIVRDPASFQAFNPAISQPVPVTVPMKDVAPKEEVQIESVRWQYSVSPEFAASKETLTLDPLAAGAGTPVDSGYSPAAVGKLIEAAPKEQVVLPDGNVTWVPLLSYAFGGGNMVHGDGQPLRENHMGRVPAANAKIRVMLLEEPGTIGPEFTIIPAKMGTVQYAGADKPSSLVDKQPMQPAFATPTTAATQITDTTAESLTTLTNSEGVAAFSLRSGSQSGKIRLMVEVIENPGASGIKPHEVVEVMVQPPLLQVGAPSATVHPVIGVVSPRQPLVATYLASYNPKDMTIIDTGMALQITEAEEGTLVMRMVETGPVVMASTPVPVKVVSPEKPPSGILSGIIEAILSIPKQIIGIFTGGEEEVARPADGIPCNDGNACTTGDFYRGGICVGGPPLDCNDGNPRTEDYCDPKRGCRHEPIGEGVREGPCDDGNACTTNDMYEGGVCVGGPPLECDDGNPETEDWCDPERGCRHEAISEGIREGPCEDGNACTTNDRYEGDVCIGGPPLNCDDRNPETEDWCDPERGCRHEPIGEGIREGPCDDGNACTTNDRYEGGVCIGGSPLDCDDGNARTEDWCDPEMGCLHEPIGTAIPDGTPCDDGNACTTGDYYRAGVCVGGLAINCDDNNPATDDWCDPAIGCQHSSAVATCPRGCECLTEAEADSRFMNFVQCLDEPCGYTTPVRGYSEPKYCYRSAG